MRRVIIQFVFFFAFWNKCSLEMNISVDTIAIISFGKRFVRKNGAELNSGHGGISTFFNID